jgi:dienelactone hydrolase
MAFCADCLKGSLDQGTPRGKDSSIAGFPCYLTQPSADTANGCAVILATDVFGYQLINARLIADAYADAGYICVVPDCFQGEPMSTELMESDENLHDTKSLLGKARALLQLIWVSLQQPMVSAQQRWGYGWWFGQ